jgi:hypothetical protein
MDTRAKPATAENPAFLDRPAVSPATESFRALDHAKEAVIARMTGGPVTRVATSRACRLAHSSRGGARQATGTCVALRPEHAAHH